VSKVVEIMAIAGAYWISPWKQCGFYDDLTVLMVCLNVSTMI
jgi:hypothetical protein